MNAHTPIEAASRVAPHNSEAEQALLGAVLMNNEVLYRVSDYLLPEHFYEGVHAKIFQLCGSVIRAGKLASPVTIKTFLPPDLEIGGLTGAQYLSRLATEAATVMNAGEYGRVIYELAGRRAIIAVSQDLFAGAHDAPADVTVGTLVEDAERALYTVAEEGRYDGGFLRFAQALTTAVDMAAQAYQRDGRLSGLATGLTDLDRLMGGLQKSDLIVIGGRPGMGKTALATGIAYKAAKAWRGEVRPDGHVETVNGAIVGFFSLEMSAEQLATRIISEQTGIASHRIRRGEIDPNDFDRIATLAREIESLPLYIDQTGGISLAQLRARARRLKRQRGLDLMVVDYIQLLSGSGKKNDNRVAEVTEITTGLKALAKDLGVPIVALSQLNRGLEAREDKRPQLSDLRESGSIEQDADVVLFVFREEYYLKNKEPRPGTEEHFKWMTEMEAVHNVAELILGKQRHGPTGTVRVQFNGQTTSFSDLADSGHLPDRN